MADKKLTAKTHTQNFCESLSPSQRNALRTIMHRAEACADLKHALGIQKVRVISEHTRRTGKALVGRTIDLFTQSVTQDIILQ